jgi:hypothetical protein
MYLRTCINAIICLNSTKDKKIIGPDEFCHSMSYADGLMGQCQVTSPQTKVRAMCHTRINRLVPNDMPLPELYVTTRKYGLIHTWTMKH